MPPEEQRPACQDGAPSVPADVGVTDQKKLALQPLQLNSALLRPATYVAPRTASIPPELQAIPHWVSWRYELRVDKKSGKPKPTKIPIDPLTGANAKSNTRATWGAFAQAWSRFERDNLDGVGFVLTLEVGIVGIDVDKCRDPRTGAIDQEALAIMREIDSYTEVSPSGTGIRIFARGKLPPKGRKKGRLEMYVSGRFLTVTGALVELP